MPNCPNCGFPMVIRKSNSGKNQGDNFYVCSNFNNCWVTMHVNSAMSLKELEDALKGYSGKSLKKKHDLIVKEVDEIWRLEKLEKFPLKTRWAELYRKTGRCIKECIDYEDYKDLMNGYERGRAENTIYEKEMDEIEGEIEIIKKGQMEHLKKIELVINY